MYVSFVAVSVLDNTGMSGAGIYAVAGNYDFSMTDVIVEGNVAEAEGGGMLIITDHESFSITRCNFQYNEALTGTICAKGWVCLTY